MSAPDLLPSRWDATRAASLDEPQQLLYRSNLLGADRAITNYAGGNTSAKLPGVDPLTGAPVEVLWVKGSGGDLGSMGLDGFATLYLARLHALKERYRGRAHEDEMVPLLAHCVFGLNPRAPSIDTPLHAFVPHRHVDHMHPDAVIAIAAARDGERLTREVWGGRVGWLDWLRPGFVLALKLGELCQAQPELTGVVLGGHGLFTWGASAEACYQNTLATIRAAAEFLGARASDAPFGGPARATLAPARRRAFVAGFAPLLRGKLSAGGPKVGHFDDSEDVLAFVGSRRLAELAELGTSCPDHFLRTKIRPLLLDEAVVAAPEQAGEALEAALAAYRRRYAAYYERCRNPDSPRMRDADPVIVLVPGVGLLAFARDKATARVASEFYVNAIHVLRGASDVSEYVGLSEREAFAIEYWPLEEAKLARLPPPKPLAGQVALVTGGAGGIGKASAEALLGEGACVVLLDRDEAALSAAESDLAARHGPDRVRRAQADVTDEASVEAAFERAVLEYGGLDVLVSGAGIASSAPFDEITLDHWEQNLAILATGYFLVARAAFRRMKQQGRGGSIVFIGSKNALAASEQAAAYNTAKAAELHLARCIALDGAPHGIRCNVVNPDAVLKGSRIWAGTWRTERAAARGLAPEALEEHYKQR
ncbi:MAG TPA: bifunctional rhamnulose-1-phosphate aldolase/short-chain dehydrogenase, partial [Planctomycetota bacterium]